MNKDYDEDFFDNYDEDDENTEFWKVRDKRNDDIDFSELIGEFTYEEVFNMSKPLDESKYKSKYYDWNKFKVSSLDDIEQIFKDIANSKDARNLYRKINSITLAIISFILGIFITSIFMFVALIISMNTFFIFNGDQWRFYSLPFIPVFVYVWIIEYIFYNYLPLNDETGKIDLSYATNKTGFFKTTFVGLWYTHTVRRKNKNRSAYNIYNALNGKKYLIKKFLEGRYWTIRNWYLIAKYVTCGKIKISDLPKHFEDELFIYITNKDFKKNKELKHICIFKKDFALKSAETLWIFIFLFSMLLTLANAILHVVTYFYF